MGGGPENPTHMFIDDDDVVSLMFYVSFISWTFCNQTGTYADSSTLQSSRVSALVLKEEPNTDENMVMKTEDSDDDKEDVGSGVAEPDMSTHKVKLMRELKALGVNLVQKLDSVIPFPPPCYVLCLKYSPWVLYLRSIALLQHSLALFKNLTWWFHRPDYTKPLDEPSWGDSDDDEELDEEMEENADGVLDGEDEDFDDEDESSDDNDDDGIRMG